MHRYLTLFLVTLVYTVPAAAYYDFMPYDPLITFEDARMYAVESIRADLHVHYGTSSAAWDTNGYLQDTEEARAIFIPVRLGWAFDKVWDASLILDAYNYRDKRDNFYNGLADVWFSGRAMWPLRNSDSVRLGSRASFRFPIDKESPVSAGSFAFDISGVMNYLETGKRFRLDAQLGYRHDLAGDKYTRAPGPSMYIVAEPGVVIGKRENFVVSAPIGTYFGVGLITSHCFWAGLRTRYYFDENVAITLGANLPINGQGGDLDRHIYNQDKYNTVYIGIESSIPTRH